MELTIKMLKESKHPTQPELVSSISPDTHVETAVEPEGQPTSAPD